MKRAIVLLVCFSVLLAAADWRLALPGYQYSFPRDHFNHPEFQTEWWYYTGNVKAGNGREFGFELTFFRQGIDRSLPMTDAWKIDQVYMAHLALSDLDKGRFFHKERLNRPGPGLAGASLEQRRVWNGNWQVRWEDERTQQLQAVHEDFTLRFTLNAAKPPAIHGKNGISQKTEGEGRASHYVSFTRPQVDGDIVLEGETIPVTGSAWMDHEFFTHKLMENQQGWDWFAIQLEDNTELMVYRLRLNDGTPDPYSSGSFIDAGGNVTHLTLSDYSLEPGRRWKSPDTGAEYPLEWKISVPKLGLELHARPKMDRQELLSPRNVGPVYWEGAMQFDGSRNGESIQGQGYLEMTGYAESGDLSTPVEPVAESR
jgi:predicted secreted hydrolase